LKSGGGVLSAFCFVFYVSFFVLLWFYLRAVY